MRRDHIDAGCRYTDGKGNVRVVIAEGPPYRLYDGQAKSDNLCYRVVERRTGPTRVGSERNSTRASFAAWAKAQV